MTSATETRIKGNITRLSHQEAAKVHLEESLLLELQDQAEEGVEDEEPDRSLRSSDATINCQTTKTFTCSVL